MPKLIRIIMGSKSDLEVVGEAINVLKEFNIDFETKVLSAHRTPKELVSYVEDAVKDGVEVFIAAAGGSAALAGVVASHTILPVIGIPLEAGALKGLDALLSTVQMPGGVPVACMSIGKWGAKNAALFALQILALRDKELKVKLVEYRKKTAQEIISIKV